MKRPFFLLALLACGAPLLQAVQLYDITLSNAEKYTQCRIKYTGSSITKFTGKDKKGAEVEMEVKTTSILLMKEVKEAAPEKTEPAPAEPGEPQEPAQDGQNAAPPDDSQPAGDKAEDAESKAPETERQETAIPGQDQSDNNAQDSATRLRNKMAQVEGDFASLNKPSRTLASRMKNGKSRIDTALQRLDKIAIELASLQEQYSQSDKADYAFTHVSADQRDKYVQDGQAAYKAMLIDVQEKKRSRKLGGIDKFEILRERYQGIPEYKDAYNWYIRTLKDLEKRYASLIAKEDKRRRNLQPAKREAMEADDQKSYEKLAAKFEAEGENIATVWYNPDTRNRYMLNAALTKVKDALRRNENAQIDEAAGTVPALLENYWAAMDKARMLMLNGDLEGAEEALQKDPSFTVILRLRSQLLPEEFKTPLRQQRQDLEKEIKKRSRVLKDLQRKIEQHIANLERSAGSIEAQIDALAEAIAIEKDMEAANDTVELEQDQPSENKEANRAETK